MLGRLPIPVVMLCLVSTGALAESIPLQHNPALVYGNHPIRATAKPDSGSPATAGDLGRSFVHTEPRFFLRGGGLGSRVDGLPPGSLVTSRNQRLNFGFYRRSQYVTRDMDALTDLLMRTLFERKPKGPRGRRELAEANAR
jgi:hypothetical protein